MIVAVCVSFLLQSHVVGVFAGLLLAVFAIVSFVGDMKSVNYFESLGRLHARYEWSAAFALVFDVALCIVGLAKAADSSES